MSAVPAFGLVQVDGYLDEYPGAFDADLNLFAYEALIPGPDGTLTMAPRIVGPIPGPPAGSYVKITSLEGAVIA